MRIITCILLCFIYNSLLSQIQIVGMQNKCNHLQMITMADIQNEYARNYFNKHNPHLIAEGDLDSDKTNEYVAAFHDTQNKSNKWYIIIMKKMKGSFHYIADFEFIINNIEYSIIKNKDAPYIHVAEAESGAIWKIIYNNNKYVLLDVGY